MKLEHTRLKPHLEAKGGTHICNAINEAIQYALEQRIDVVLKHNERLYIIRPEIILAEILKQNEVKE